MHFSRFILANLLSHPPLRRINLPNRGMRMQLHINSQALVIVKRHARRARNFCFSLLDHLDLATFPGRDTASTGSEFLSGLSAAHDCGTYQVFSFRGVKESWIKLYYCILCSARAPANATVLQWCLIDRRRIGLNTTKQRISPNRASKPSFYAYRLASFGPS